MQRKREKKRVHCAQQIVQSWVQRVVNLALAKTLDCLQNRDSTDFLRGRVSIHPGRFAFPGKKQPFVYSFYGLMKTTVQACDRAGMGYVYGLPQPLIISTDSLKEPVECVHSPAFPLSAPILRNYMPTASVSC